MVRPLLKYLVWMWVNCMYIYYIVPHKTAKGCICRFRVLILNWNVRNSSLNYCEIIIEENETIFLNSGGQSGTHLLTYIRIYDGSTQYCLSCIFFLKPSIRMIPYSTVTNQWHCAIYINIIVMREETHIIKCQHNF